MEGFSIKTSHEVNRFCAEDYLTHASGVTALPNQMLFEFAYLDINISNYAN